MAIKLERKTQSHQLLKLVSVDDDAIDWQATYPDDHGDAGTGGEMTDEERQRKRARYLARHDIRELVFAEGAQPTVFVFEHPSRIDVDRKLRRSWTELLKPGSKSDIWTDVWNETFLGIEEGIVDAPRQPPPRQGDALTAGFLQALADAGVFAELGQAVVDLARGGIEARGSTATKKK